MHPYKSPKASFIRTYETESTKIKTCPIIQILILGKILVTRCIFCKAAILLPHICINLSLSYPCCVCIVSMNEFDSRIA